MTERTTRPFNVSGDQISYRPFMSPMARSEALFKSIRMASKSVCSGRTALD